MSLISGTSATGTPSISSSPISLKRKTGRTELNKLDNFSAGGSQAASAFLNKSDSEDVETSPEAEAQLNEALLKQQIDQASGKAPVKDLASTRMAQLRAGEHVLPDDVMDAYAQTVDSSVGFAGTAPAGGYLADNYLDTRKERKTFDNKLQDLGYGKSERKRYSKLLKTKDIVILKESTLKGKMFNKAVPHERMHREFSKIDKQDYQEMMDTAKKLVRERNEDDSPVVRERAGSKYLGGFARMNAHRNPEEFYTYLAQGEFTEETEQALKRASPKSYELFQALAKKTALK